MNPQSITDAAVAILDACGDDPALSHEAAMFAMRVLQVPQSQLEKLYFDEINLSGAEASKLTPAELAGRYAEYKIMRGTPLAPWSWGDEERLGNLEGSAKKRMKERLEALGERDEIAAYADYESRYKSVNKRMENAKELLKTDYEAGAAAYAELQQDPDLGVYQRFGGMNKGLNRLTKQWLKAETTEEAQLLSKTVTGYRSAMVKALQAESAEEGQAAMQELSELMSEFSTKLQEVQTKR